MYLCITQLDHKMSKHLSSNRHIMGSMVAAFLQGPSRRSYDVVLKIPVMLDACRASFNRVRASSWSKSLGQIPALTSTCVGLGTNFVIYCEMTQSQSACSHSYCCPSGTLKFDSPSSRASCGFHRPWTVPFEGCPKAVM